MIHRQEAVIGGRVMSIETGRVAEQANGAVLVGYGVTVILATAVGSDEPREGIDFFPLTVDVEERMYAAGKIPGGFIKREGRATEHAILASRLTDRPLRPLFPKGYRNDVQIIITVLSVDQENDPNIMGIVGASAALSLSDIPFYGPVGAVSVGYIDDQLVINPVELHAKVSEFVVPRFEAAVSNANKAARSAALNQVQDELVTELGTQYPDRLKDLITFYETELKSYVRNAILDQGQRPDGRDLKT